MFGSEGGDAAPPVNRSSARSSLPWDEPSRGPGRSLPPLRLALPRVGMLVPTHWSARSDPGIAHARGWDRTILPLGSHNPGVGTLVPCPGKSRAAARERRADWRDMRKGDALGYANFREAGCLGHRGGGVPDAVPDDVAGIANTPSSTSGFTRILSTLVAVCRAPYSCSIRCRRCQPNSLWFLA